jgi:hypothetical protein
VNASDDDGNAPRGASPKSAFDSADPPRNFTLRVDERIRALTIGAPAYATRKKHIEDLEERFVETLVALHDALVIKQERQGRRERSDEGTVARAVVEKAASLDLKRINALIASHNRYYPMEANLPMDTRTGEYLVYGRRWTPEEPWTAARLVERARAVIAARRVR